MGKTKQLVSIDDFVKKHDNNVAAMRIVDNEVGSGTGGCADGL